MVPRPLQARALLSLAVGVGMALAAWAAKSGPWGGLLGLAAGLAVWLRPGEGGGSAAPPRLQLEGRLALSSRTGVALLAVEGERFLVVHGDRFARLQPLELDPLGRDEELRLATELLMTLPPELKGWRQ